MAKKIVLKIREWIKRHIVDVVPPHLDDLFDNKEEIELWECATCGSRGVCSHCKINSKL